jgi:hypothetical protein
MRKVHAAASVLALLVATAVGATDTAQMAGPDVYRSVLERNGWSVVDELPAGEFDYVASKDDYLAARQRGMDLSGLLGLPAEGINGDPHDGEVASTRVSRDGVVVLTVAFGPDDALIAYARPGYRTAQIIRAISCLCRADS